MSYIFYQALHILKISLRTKGTKKKILIQKRSNSLNDSRIKWHILYQSLMQYICVLHILLCILSTAHCTVYSVQDNIECSMYKLTKGNFNKGLFSLVLQNPWAQFQARLNLCMVTFLESWGETCVSQWMLLWEARLDISPNAMQWTRGIRKQYITRTY